MKIIKNGKDRYFKCPFCKCRFKASCEEYKVHVHIDGDATLTVKCPYCEHLLEKYYSRRKASVIECRFKLF